MEIPGPGRLFALPAAIRLMRDPRALIVDNTRRYGSVWQTHFPDGRRLKSLVWLMGPEGNARILAKEHRDDFSWYEGYRFAMEPMFGKDILFLLDGSPHRARYDALIPALGAHGVAAYVPAIERIVAAHLARWRSESVLDLAEEMKRITFHVVAHLLLGAADGEVDELTRSFEEIGLGLFTAFHVAVPGFDFYRGVKARRRLTRLLGARIADYRKRQALPENMLGMLMASRTQTGEPLPDESLISEMLAFLFAGYDTTSSMLTSFWVELARRPDVHAAIRDESRQLSASAAPGDGGPWLKAALLETERLEPPLAFAMRGVTRDIEFGGYRIEAGSKVAYSPYYTGRLARLFERPTEFRPERFVDGTKPPPFSVLGFGGGHRSCIGKRFAMLEMRLIIAAILREVRLDFVPNQREAVFFNPTLQRTNGFLARVTRH